MNRGNFCLGALTALLCGCLLAPAAQAAQPGPAGQELGLAVAAVTAPASAQQWQTLLVNPWNPVPQDWKGELVKLDNGMQVDKRMYDALNTMLDDCRAAGLDVRVCSAYRTQATQTRLHNNKIARLRAAGYSAEKAREEAARWVAAPGTSEHQTGLAVDLVSGAYQILDEKQADTPEQQWLMAHCWEYGFILRYPTEKSSLTGIGYEPWHYRYVGPDVAKVLERSGLCLEEYVSLRNALAK